MTSVHTGNRKTEQTGIPNQCFSFLMRAVVQKPTPHCGRWSGSNHPGSCSCWGRCSPFGSGTCNDREVLVGVRSHLCGKYTPKKRGILSLPSLFASTLLSSAGCFLFSMLLPPGSPSAEEKSNIYLTQPIQLAARLPGTRPVAGSFSAANTLLSRSKQLFSYV